MSTWTLKQRPEVKAALRTWWGHSYFADLLQFSQEVCHSQGMSAENRFHKQFWKLSSDTTYRETITNRNDNKHLTQQCTKTRKKHYKDQAKNTSTKLPFHLSPSSEGTLVNFYWSMGWIPDTPNLSAQRGTDLRRVTVVHYPVDSRYAPQL